MIEDHAGDGIRSLFDWRSAPQGRGEADDPLVADDELARALGLLSCNPRDRERFQRGQAPADR